MTLPPVAERWSLSTNPLLWQKRALRYLLIYLLLAISLMTIRSLTKDIRPAWRASQTLEGQLTAQKDDLEVQLQALITPQRIQSWARRHDMIPFAQASKEKRPFEPGPPPPTPLSRPPQLEVITRWN